MPDTEEILEQPVSMFMTTGELVTAKTTDALDSILQTFDEARINHVPVLDGERLVGIISLADALKLGVAAQQGGAAKVATAADVMTQNLETIRPTTPLRHAAQLFASGDFHSLLVTDTEGELLGIVTSSDVIRALTEAPRADESEVTPKD